MASEDKFFRNYVVLKPEQASFFDLFRILFSSEINKRQFIESQDTQNFEYRWIIFLSMVLLKLLLLLKKPMKLIGSLLTSYLNFLSINGGFFSLLKNIITGKVVPTPIESSANYKSVLAYADERVELSKSIKNGDKKYATSLSMMAAKLAYENAAFVQTTVTDHWKMDFLGFFDFWNDYEEEKTTQAMMFQDTSSNPELIVVAFRGTEPFNADDWVTDVDLSWYEIEDVGRIHLGFMKGLGLQKGEGWPKNIIQSPKKQFAYYTLRENLRELLKMNKNAKFVVTGHSLGAALAILFVAVLGLHEETELFERLEGVYTFAQPRVGNKQFGKYMDGILSLHNVNYIRFVYCNDVVPRVPWDVGNVWFKHFGNCYFYNSCYKVKVVADPPNKNCWSPFYVIPNFLNAVWELIRSFILRFLKGSDYKEGLFLKLLRVIALALPGIVVHGPQDYTNLSRLGSLPSSLSNKGRLKHDSDQMISLLLQES